MDQQCKGCSKSKVLIVNNRAGFPLCDDCGRTGIDLKLTSYASQMLVALLQGEMNLEVIEFQESFLDGIRKSNPEFVDPRDGESPDL